MGMLLIDPGFAGRIMEKYSFAGSYGFDEESLIFYQEDHKEKKEASSAYDTELTLKLLFMFQNYQQSGQYLHINWNLLTQTILRQTSAISSRMQQMTAPVLQAVKTLQRDQMLRTPAEKNYAAGKNVRESDRQSLREIHMDSRQLLRDLRTERESLKIFREAGKRAGSSEAEKLAKQETEQIVLRELMRLGRSEKTGYFDNICRVLKTETAAVILKEYSSQLPEAVQILEILSGTENEEEKQRKITEILKTETVQRRFLQESLSRIDRIQSLTDTEKVRLRILMREAGEQSGKVRKREKTSGVSFHRDQDVLGILRKEDGYKTVEQGPAWGKQEKEQVFLRKLIRLSSTGAGRSAGEIYRLMQTDTAITFLKERGSVWPEAEQMLGILSGSGTGEEKQKKLTEILESETVKNRILQESLSRIGFIHNLTEIQKERLSAATGRTGIFLNDIPHSAAERETVHEGSEKTAGAERTIDEEIRRLVLENLKGTSAGGGRRIRFLNGIGISRLRFSFLHRQESHLTSEHIEKWMGVLSEEERSTVWRELIRISDSMVYRTWENAGEVREFLSSVMKIRKEEQAAEDRRQSEGNNLYRLMRQVPETSAAFLRWILGQNGQDGPGTVGALFRKYEEQIFRQTQEEKEQEIFRKILEKADAPEESAAQAAVLWEKMPLTSRMITILESRLTEPEKAEKAEKELAEILIRDFQIQNRELIFHDDGDRISPQKRDRQIQTFLKFLKAPEVSETIERKIRYSDENRRRKLEEWIRTYQKSVVVRQIQESGEGRKLGRGQKKAEEKEKRTAESMIRLLISGEKAQQRMLVFQVRDRLGARAAGQLEEYFRSRESTAEDAAKTRSMKQMEQTARSLIDTYLSMVQREMTVSSMGDGSELFLQNQQRAVIHHPSSGAFLAARRSTESILRLIRRNYLFRQENRLMTEQIRHSIVQTGTDAGLRKIEEREIPYARQNAEYDLMQNRLLERTSENQMRFPKTAEFGRMMLERIKASGAGLEKMQDVGNQDTEIRSYSGLRTGLENRNYGVHPVQETFSRPGERTSPGLYYPEQAQTEFLRRQKKQEAEIEETRTVVKRLNEKLEIQQKLMEELKKKTSGPQVIPPQISISQLTRQVMKRMEDELRTEKMRRGIL